MINIFFGQKVVSLANSVNTPWGIITSNFVFDGIQNMYAMLLFLVFLYLSNISFVLKLRKARYISTIVSMFFGGFFANFLWFNDMLKVGSTITSAGQSGVVYAFWGACFSLVLFDTLIILIGKGVKLIRKKPSQIEVLKSSRKKLRWMGAISSVLVSISVLADLYDGQKAFFSESPHINYFVHTAAFFSGMAISAFVYLLMFIRLSIKIRPDNVVQS
jgi:hypothetical protein